MNRFLTVITISAVAVLSLGACSSSDSSGTSSSAPATRASSASTSQQPALQPTGTTRPDPRGLATPVASTNRHDATATASEFLTVLNTQDTRIDVTPWNAADRAANLATASYAAQLRQQVQQAPGAMWDAMAAAKGYTTAEVKEVHSDDPPPSTETDSYLTYAVTMITHGSSAAPLKSSVFVHLTRPDATGQWSVASSQSTYS